MPNVGPLGNIIIGTNNNVQHTVIVTGQAPTPIPVPRPTDHGSLAGLGDDDHPQYFKTSNLSLLSSLAGVNIEAAGELYSNGTVYFYGGNNITLSTVGNSISIIGQLGGGGGANASIIGNTAGVPSLISTGTMYLAGGSNITLSQNGNSISILAASQSVQTQGTFNTTQLNNYQLTADNSLSLGTIYTSHTHSQYIYESQSSFFQLTGDNSLSLGVGYTTHTHSDYVNTSASSLFALTANDSLSLGVNYTTHTHADYINTGNSTLFQLTADNSLSLGTGYTTHTHSQYVNTSVSSNFLTTAALSNHSHNFATTTTNGSLIVVATTNSAGATIAVPSFLTTAQAPGAYLTTARASTDAIGLNTAQSNVTWTANSSGLSIDARGYAGTGTSATNASITLNSNGLQISVAAPGGGAQTAISGLALSNTTYTSGTASFRDLNGISWQSTTGQGIQITHGLQFTSNTSAITSNAFNTSGSSNFVLTANSSLFQHTTATSAITSNALNTSVARIQGIIGSNTTYTSGSVSLRDLNGITFQSTTGQAFQITHDLQYTSNTSNITANAFNTSGSSRFVQNWKLTGNSAGTSSSAAGSDLWLAGGNGVTLSGSSNTISISVATNYQSQGAYLTTAAQSTQTIAISLGGNSGTTGSSNITAGGYVLAGGNNVTLSQSNNSISIHAQSQSVQTQSRFNMTLSGNSTSGGAGYIQISSGTLTLAGGNNITISQDGNALTISGPNVGGAQTGISGVILSNTTYTSGTISFRDLNGISWQSTTGQAIQLTHDLQYTSNTSNITANAFATSASSRFVQNWKITGNTSGTTSSAQGSDLWLAGGNGVTISGSSNTLSFSVATNYQSQGAYLTTARASTDAVGLNTALTANGVAWTVNSSGISLNVPAFLTTADLSQNSSNYLRNWKLTGNTSGTTSSAQGTDLWLAGGNGVTISGSSNTLSFSVATNYQSQGAYLTTAALSGDTTKYVQAWEITGNTAGTSSSAQGTKLYLSGGNNITLSGSSNTIVFSVPSNSHVASASNGSFSFQTLNFSNANNVTFGTSAGGIITASVNAGGGGIAASIGGNSTSAGAGYSNITSGTAVFMGGPNITLSQNGASISISANNPGAAVENNWFNLLGANTAGNTTASGSTIGMSGINLTLSGTNGSVMNISAPATSSLSGTGLLSISANGSTISLGVAGTTISRQFFMPYGQISSSGMTNSQMSMRYFSIDDAISFTRVEIPMNVSITSSGANNTGNIVFTSGAAIYSRNGSTLNPIVGSTGSTTYTWASNTSGYTELIGGRFASWGLASTLPPGEYWLGVFMSTNNNSSIGTATTQLANTISVFVGSFLTAQNFADFGVATTQSSVGIMPMQGLVSITISNTTMTYQQSQITQSGAQGMRGNIWFNLRNV